METKLYLIVNNERNFQSTVLEKRWHSFLFLLQNENAIKCQCQIRRPSDNERSVMELANETIILGPGHSKPFLKMCNFLGLFIVVNTHRFPVR